MERQFEWDAKRPCATGKIIALVLTKPLKSFRDLNGIEEIDEDHSTEEETRFYRIGFSGTRLLYVVFAVVDPNIIRIIHARVASKVIARRYEKRKE